jgi:low temperature requirement protein LtrA
VLPIARAKGTLTPATSKGSRRARSGRTLTARVAACAGERAHARSPSAIEGGGDHRARRRGDEEPGEATLLRNHGGGPAPVSYLELFFDLVYVFALTQISHLILATMSWRGLAEASIVFAAIWWAWMYTTWAANWLDPERVPVRVLLLLVMLASLLMAVALPHAFDGGALLFAGAYVAIQVGRTLFLALVMSRSQNESGLNMLRIALWFIASGVLWMLGVLANGELARLGWWLAALAIEFAGPLALFYVPFLGGSTVGE